MGRTKVILTLFACALLANFQSALAQLEAPSTWDSGLYLDHQLVGKIWDSRIESFISSEQLSQAILSAKYLILGEKHDNPDHHALQLSVLEMLIANGRLTQLSFEMMSTNSQEILNSIGAQSLTTLDALKEYLAWDEEGWDWNFYGPLVNAAYRAGVPLAAGNISNERMGEVYGLQALPSEYNILNESTMAQLLVDIDESHCGLLPESQFPAMVRVQQARDYSLASSLAEPSEEGTNVLIAGNYHARQDLGVPNYLVAQHSDVSLRDVVSLGILEVSSGENNPEAYLQRYNSQAAYDYIWFTPVISEEDYCASLRQ